MPPTAHNAGKRRRIRLPLANLAPGRGRRALPLREGERPTPSLAVWAVTQACDQRCVSCGPRSGKRLPDELTTDEALALVSELAELGVGEVVLIGGEAYLRSDYLLIIRAIREHGMKASMTTGGYGFTRDKIREAVHAGLESVSFSIDGLQGTHDELRGRPGSWSRAMDGISAIRDAGAVPATNTQINRRTMNELPALADRLGAARIEAWQLFFTIPHGRAADRPDLVLQPYMVLDAYDRLEETVKRCRTHGIRIWPGNNLGYFGPLESALRQHQNAEARYLGCQAGLTGLGIEADGTIKSCPSLGGAANTAGSWREHGLRALWERAPEMRRIERRTVDDLWGYCRSCYYARECMGGCTATSEPLFGRPGNNPFCHHRALEFDRQGLRERLVPVASAPGRPFDHGRFELVTEPKQ